MTRDEILKLEAGREMDALIAHDVMGLKKIVIGGIGWWVKESPLEMSYQYMEKSGDFEPSEDMNAAWQVVAKMREKGFDFFAEWVTENAVSRLNSLPWACFATDDNDSVFVDFTATAETMPLAICRAALLAVMECDE
jgi:hypothetical protein